MSSLLNISEGTSLAFHALALIAEKAPERQNAKSLAADLHASEAHLAKILQRLNKAGIISSARGPSGGFILNKPAEEISFLDVYEVLESSVTFEDCPLGKNQCSFTSCIFAGKLSKIIRDAYHVLEDIKLSDFSGQDR